LPEQGFFLSHTFCNPDLYQMDFHLRPWLLTDIDCLVRYANNPRIAANLTDAFPHPYTLPDGEHFIAMATSESPVRIFAIEVEGNAAGGIGLHPQHDVYRKNMELGYWLAEPYWGKGIATRAVVQMTAYGFAAFDIERIFARPYGHNVGSQKVLEKAGYTLEARLEKTILKNGEMLDELIYAARKYSWKAPQL